MSRDLTAVYIVIKRFILFIRYINYSIIIFISFRHVFRTVYLILKRDIRCMCKLYLILLHVCPAYSENKVFISAVLNVNICHFKICHRFFVSCGDIKLSRGIYFCCKSNRTFVSKPRINRQCHKQYRRERYCYDQLELLLFF